MTVQYTNNLSVSQKENIMKSHSKSMAFLTINKKDKTVTTLGLITGTHRIDYDRSLDRPVLWVKDMSGEHEDESICFLDEIHVADIEMYILKKRPNGGMYAELLLRRPMFPLWDKDYFNKFVKELEI